VYLKIEISRQRNRMSQTRTGAMHTSLPAP
jgi:hypothetical protein